MAVQFVAWVATGICGTRIRSGLPTGSHGMFRFQIRIPVAFVQNVRKTSPTNSLLTICRSKIQKIPEALATAASVCFKPTTSMCPCSPPVKRLRRRDRDKEEPNGRDKQDLNELLKKGRWENWEKMAFLRGYRFYGRGKWTKISLLIPTR